jgi:hypothetical protein
LYANGCFIDEFHDLNISYEKPRWSGVRPWTPFGRLQFGCAGLLAVLGTLNGHKKPLLRRSVYDAYILAVLGALTLKLHKAVFLGEQCVIAAEAYISARVNACATLTNNDIPGNNLLAAVDFDA